MGWMILSLNSGRSRYLLISALSRQARRPTYPPVQWELGTYSGVKAIGVRLTTHLHLVPSLRMSQFVLPLSLYDLVAFTYKDSITFVCFISKHK